jgi:prepilin peptidase CpaA
MDHVEQSLASGAVPAAADPTGSEDSHPSNHISSEEQQARHPWRRLPWAATWVGLICLAALVNCGLVYACAGQRGFFLGSLAAVACILAAFFDAFTLRIPNYITYTAALVGLALNAVVPLFELMHADALITWLGAAGWQQSLIGFGACAILGLGGSVVAGVHGGDLKLLAAMGAMLGLSVTGQALIVALAVALVYAVINLALFGRLNTILRIVAQRGLELLFLRRFYTPLPDDQVTPLSHIPMAIPMALGMAAVLYMQVRYGGGMLW